MRCRLGCWGQCGSRIVLRPQQMTISRMPLTPAAPTTTGFSMLMASRCYDAEGFVVAWENCYVAGCVVDYAFFFGDEVEAEFDVVTHLGDLR